MSSEKIFVPMPGTFGGLIGEKWKNILYLEKKHHVDITKIKQKYSSALLISGRNELSVQEAYEDLQRKHCKLISFNKQKSNYKKKQFNQLKQILQKTKKSTSKTNQSKSNIKKDVKESNFVLQNKFSALYNDSDSEESSNDSCSDDI